MSDWSWGSMVDSVSGAVDSWFSDGTNVDTPSNNGYDAYDTSDLASSEFDDDSWIADAIDTDDSMWDDAWNSVFDTASSIGSGIADFAGTKGGQQAIGAGIGVLGQWLMGDSSTGKKAPSTGRSSGGSSGRSSGGSSVVEEPKIVQGRTTSNLASKMVR